MDVVALIAWCAAVLGTSTALPQFLRIRATRSVAGVSPRLWQLSAVNSIGWTVHGFATGQPAIAWPTLVLLILQVGILVLVSKHHATPALQAFVLPVTGGGLLIVTDLVLGPAAFGAMATVAPFLGQMAGLRTMTRATDLRGVSRACLALNLASNLTWVVYGILAVEWAMRVSATAQSTICVVVMGYYLWRRAALSRAAVGVTVRTAA